MVGPAGLEPAITKSQVAEAARDSEHDLRANSTSVSTVLADLAATVREALAAGLGLPRQLRADIARLLVEAE